VLIYLTSTLLFGTHLVITFVVDIYLQYCTLICLSLHYLFEVFNSLFVRYLILLVFVDIYLHLLMLLLFWMIYLLLSNLSVVVIRVIYSLLCCWLSRLMGDFPYDYFVTLVNFPRGKFVVPISLYDILHYTHDVDRLIYIVPEWLHFTRVLHSVFGVQLLLCYCSDVTVYRPRYFVQTGTLVLLRWSRCWYICYVGVPRWCYFTHTFIFAFSHTFLPDFDPSVTFCCLLLLTLFTDDILLRWDVVVVNQLCWYSGPWPTILLLHCCCSLIYVTLLHSGVVDRCCSWSIHLFVGVLLLFTVDDLLVFVVFWPYVPICDWHILLFCVYLHLPTFYICCCVFPALFIHSIHSVVTFLLLLCWYCLCAGMTILLIHWYL